jgi:MFS family permease
VTRFIDLARQQSLAWLVFFVIVVDLIGFGIVIPILPFLSPQLGGGTDDIAFILVTYSVAAAIVAPIWGKLSDHFGRRHILGICLLGGALSHFYWRSQIRFGWSTPRAQLRGSWQAACQSPQP